MDYHRKKNSLKILAHLKEKCVKIELLPPLMFSTRQNLGAVEGKGRRRYQRPVWGSMRTYSGPMLSNISTSNGLALVAEPRAHQLTWLVTCHPPRMDKLAWTDHISIQPAAQPSSWNNRHKKASCKFMGNNISPTDISQLSRVTQPSSLSDYCFLTSERHFSLISSISETSLFEIMSIRMRHPILPVDLSHFDAVT